MMRARRRTQEERTAATRARLLEATLECLCELGWARTTTTEIAERAGVSRGAQMHHFPTKSELVLSAIEHLIERRNDEFRMRFEALPPGADHRQAAVDILWDLMQGKTFYAWLELAVAARTDKTLREQLARLGKRSMQLFDRTFRDLFPAPARPNPLFDLAPRMAFAIMHGMAVNRLVVDDPAEQSRMVGLVKLLATLVPFGDGGGK
jgi:AcrR family transcriptional regulator